MNKFDKIFIMFLGLIFILIFIVIPLSYSADLIIGQEVVAVLQTRDKQTTIQARIMILDRFIQYDREIIYIKYLDTLQGEKEYILADQIININQVEILDTERE